jgi:hypothetical protein
LPGIALAFGVLSMFGFRKKKPAPPLCQSNPGAGVEARVALSTGDRSWTEKVNVVNLAAEVLHKHGHAVTNEKTWLQHADSGFMILPQLVAIQPLEGGVQTVTTVQVNHPTLAPRGVFEYQHSAGDSIAAAITKGIDQWVQMDYAPLLGATRARPESCTVMEMAFPAKDGVPARTRRAILGPVAHFMQQPPGQAEGNASEEHPFCPCCLLTRSFEAFKELIEGHGFYGLRLFAARDTEGVPQADCRVNGEDWERGAQALCEYARTWPPAGYEFRKQYVVLQTIEKGADSA